MVLGSRLVEVTRNPMNGGEACPKVLIQTQGGPLEVL